MDQVDNLNPKFVKEKKEDKIEVVMLGTIMVSRIIKIDTGQLVKTRDGIDRIEVDQDINTIIEVDF